jgi:hypothetical protein
MDETGSGETQPFRTRSMWPFKVISLTAIASFILGALGQYAVGHLADNFVGAVTSDVEAEMPTPMHQNLSVMIPPSTNLVGRN